MANKASVLVSQLNALLRQLQIPITLEFPTDLTPSLLLAVLESILSARIPIPSDLRRRLQLHDFDAKVRCMKIFLGVLESDVLKTDVGFSNVDPRRLARGEWDEVVYVGELLCSIGELVGLLPQQAKSATAGPVPLTAARAGVRRTGSSTLSGPSAHRSSAADRSAASDPGPQQSFSYAADGSTESIARRTRLCIHESDTPKLLSSRRHFYDAVTSPTGFTYCNCAAAKIRHLSPSKSVAASPTRTANTSPVRRNGYIASVDEDEELHSFDTARSSTVADEDTSRFSFEHVSSYLDSTTTVDLGPSTSSHSRTLHLKRERARLLSELAKLAVPRRTT
ncbi:hypothetical protein BD626DRAFT_504477 [Schizophyllum amplum]|uniref:DUF5745 domain-containing protein n=1 Tax=Schizophyllum amplum TaxID=97359 RepID=A0A550C6Y4_9AGAR|nr:hypothetical protein BD626DRAFT_504477 [Auriculariopsis ampla]